MSGAGIIFYKDSGVIFSQLIFRKPSAKSINATKVKIIYRTFSSSACQISFVVASKINATMWQ